MDLDKCRWHRHDTHSPRHDGADVDREVNVADTRRTAGQNSAANFGLLLGCQRNRTGAAALALLDSRAAVASALSVAILGGVAILAPTVTVLCGALAGTFTILRGIAVLASTFTLLRGVALTWAILLRTWRCRLSVTLVTFATLLWTLLVSPPFRCAPDVPDRSRSICPLAPP